MELPHRIIINPSFEMIRVQTREAYWWFKVDDDNRLLFFQIDIVGEEEEMPFEKHPAIPVFPTYGAGWTNEAALKATHADGNTSTDLRYVAHEQTEDLLTIHLQDSYYSFSVDLKIRTIPELDIFECWTEIEHSESGEVVLENYASSVLVFGKEDVHLTQFHGAWEDEAGMEEERLGAGIKILDSKLGVRANEYRHPWFLLSRGQSAFERARSTEHPELISGEIWAGSLAWPGSFRFAFERLPKGRILDGYFQAIAGINPLGAEIHLAPGERFVTPKMIWAFSQKGTGHLSRNLHRYVREKIVRDPEEERAILLNNWEATYFDFDEVKIQSLIRGAADLGMELFLLDDGWFGRKYPRDGDTQGLGDWMPDAKKLPNGLGTLVQTAHESGIRFGIWLEPEMVNPKSELFEAHPDWAVQQPHRELDLSRNQLVLDLTNPEVEEYVYNLVRETLENGSAPDGTPISYIKWDCNRFITQPGSPYLPKERQSHLWIEYVRALTRVFERVKADYPQVEIMMCSGGGGRVDYDSLRFAHEFWPSDRTDPVDRIRIQWGYSHFFPAIATSNHVTLMGGGPLRFAFDVAMSGRLGLDLDLDKLSPDDLELARDAIARYKGIRSIVQFGDLYRLQSPYEGPRSALMYTHGSEAVVFVYATEEAEAAPLVLAGLDRNQRYRVSDLYGWGPELEVSGADLLTAGLPIEAMPRYGSYVWVLSTV